MNLLIKWRDKVQAFCFYWKESHKRGRCKEMNGHYCVFCELSDGFDADLATESSLPPQASREAGLDRSIEWNIRSWLWDTHGHTALYGDDGEMQCHECHLDYKRAPLIECFERANTELGLVRLKALRAEPTQRGVASAAQQFTTSDGARALEAVGKPYLIRDAQVIALHFSTLVGREEPAIAAPLKVGKPCLVRAEFLGSRGNEARVALKSCGSVTNWDGEAQISVAIADVRALPVASVEQAATASTASGEKVKT